MKKLLLLILLFFGSKGFSYSQDFIVNSFSADIYVHQEGYFDVVEKYDIHFQKPKHGILRDIITKFDYKNEKGVTEKRRIYISNVEVPDNKFKVSKGDDLLTDQVQIKIGDANKTIIGDRHYEIKYRVTNALFFTDNQVQLYWNIKPPDWITVFNSINFNIHVPEGITLSTANCFTYSGFRGNTNISNNFNYSFSNNIYSAKSVSGFTSIIGESVTILVKMPQASIQQPNLTSIKIRNYGWIGILFIFFLWVMRIRMKYKPKKTLAITSYYPPKGIDAPTAGYLIDDSGDQMDLISLLPKWGNEGLIRMEVLHEKSFFSSPNIKIIKLKELPKTVPLYEKIFFTGLFSDFEGMGKTLMKELSFDFFKNNESIEQQITKIFQNNNFESKTEVETKDLKNSFYKVMNTAKSALSQSAEKYYDLKTKNAISWATLWVFFTWLAMTICFIYFFNPVAAIVSGILGFISLFFIISIRKKNTEGSAILEELKGFKQFIKLADIERIKVLLIEDPQYFEKTMSYALAFGMLEKWAAQFEALNHKEPSWYSGGTMNSFGSSGGFAKSFAGSMSAANSSMVSALGGSSSSGGGSSGGGAGGGGGGSW
ncbi:MAG TPA: DUF2207 domain-containing protein [Edaphocola sp.]|nr:DUF2207 domain-containing protein [Edaphocola sp.]